MKISEDHPGRQSFREAIIKNKFVSQFDPTPHMVTDVQGSRYEVVADNGHNNAHSIFRHISDIKLYKPYQYPQRYHPPPPLSPDTNIAP